MNPFQSKKSIWWGIGVSTLLLGVLVYAVFMPNIVQPYGSDAPDVRVPNMRNVPEQPGALRRGVQDLPERDDPPKL
jgi:hypothetical protein